MPTLINLVYIASMAKLGRILITDDDATLRRMLKSYLSAKGFEPIEAADGTAALKAVVTGKPDMVLLDIKMPGISGINVLRRLSVEHPALPVVMVTGYGDVPTAIEAMRLGAQDFIQKPFELEHMLHVINKIIERRELGRKAASLDAQYENSLELMMGRSQRMRSVIAELRRVADTNMSVVISGETGTGKTYLASLIHNLSSRRERPFMIVDFGTIPDSLVESEMFGFERGAFTGAERTTAGYFEKADGGTIFIDELQNITVGTQQKLLKVIEDKGFYAIGGSKRISTDFRVVCATNCNIKEAVRLGSIRSDLYYRLSEYAIELPPLRERTEDIPLFVDKFLVDLSGELGRKDISITAPAMDVLCSCRWDGNIRELKNVVRNSIVWCESGHIGPDIVRCAINGRSATEARGRDMLALDSPHPVSLQEAERYAIGLALKHTSGNKTRASLILKVTLKTLLKKIRDYGIETAAK